jgi:hypothetical protein
MSDKPKSTGAFPMTAAPDIVFSRESDELDWSGSTMAFPMGPAMPMVIVSKPVDAEGRPIDYTRSSRRFPTFGPVPAVEHVVAVPAAAGGTAKK